MGGPREGALTLLFLQGSTSEPSPAALEKRRRRKQERDRKKRKRKELRAKEKVAKATEAVEPPREAPREPPREEAQLGLLFNKVRGRCGRAGAGTPAVSPAGHVARVPRPPVRGGGWRQCLPPGALLGAHGRGAP